MNKKFWMALMAASVLCFAPACSDDDGPVDPDPEPEIEMEMVVYATGGDGTQGVYWRNGEAVTLKSPNSETPKWTRGKSIAVVNGDVYVAGYESKTAILWKNGEPTALTDNSTELSVHDMAIVGEDIYIVGAYDGAGVYWKNGQMIELTSSGEVRTVVVDGDDIYMAGNDRNVATYWKNGEPTALSKDQWSFSDVYGLSITEGSVVAAGYYDAEAATWLIKNGEVTETILTEDWNYAQCRGVAVANGVTCAVGNDGYNPVYWMGNTMTKLAECTDFGTAIDVCTYGENFIIGGINDDQAVVWINGEATVLAEAKTGPCVYAVCVTEEAVVTPEE